MNARTIRLQLVFHPFFNGDVVTTLVHIYEIDNDKPRKVTQTKLTGNFISGFKVCFERCLLNAAFLGRAARVYVNRNQRLSHTNHDITTRWQLNCRVKHPCQICFNLMAREQRKAVFVALHIFCMARHDHFHEVFGRAVTGLALNKYFIDVAVIEIADRTFDQVAFLVNRGWRHRFQGKRADLLPQALQIFVIALDLRFGPLGTRGAHDQASTLRNQNLVCNFFKFFAIRRVGDLTADPSAASRIWHQDAIASR